MLRLTIKEILEPERFLKYFGHLDIAKVLYTGDLTPEFIESVRNSTLPGMTFEGVVCKLRMTRKQKCHLCSNKNHKHG